MFLNFMMAVIMLTITEASIAKRQDKMIGDKYFEDSLPIDSDHSLSSLPSKVTQNPFPYQQELINHVENTIGPLPSTVKGVPFYHQQEQINDVDDHMGSLSDDNFYYQQEMVDNGDYIELLPSLITEKSSRQPYNISGIDHHNLFQPKIVEEKTYHHPPQIFSKVQKPPSQTIIFDRQSNNTQLDYKMNSLSNKLTVNHSHLLTNQSSQSGELPFTHPKKKIEVRFLPLGVKIRQNIREVPSHSQPNLSKKVLQQLFPLQTKINEHDIPSGSLPRKIIENTFHPLSEVSSKVVRQPFNLQPSFSDVGLPLFQPNLNPKMINVPHVASALPVFTIGEDPLDGTEIQDGTHILGPVGTFSSYEESLKISKTNEPMMGTIPAASIMKDKLEESVMTTKFNESILSDESTVKDESEESKMKSNFEELLMRTIAAESIMKDNSGVSMMHNESKVQEESEKSTVITKSRESTPSSMSGESTTKSITDETIMKERLDELLKTAKTEDVMMPDQPTMDDESEESKIKRKFEELLMRSIPVESILKDMPGESIISDELIMKDEIDESMLTTHSDETFMISMLDELLKTTNSDESIYTTSSDLSNMNFKPEDSMLKIQTKGLFLTNNPEESVMITEPLMTSNSDDLTYLRWQNVLQGYGSDNTNKTKMNYCIWYDHEKDKEYHLQSGTQWSGNGCNSFECRNGVIIPDPTCCKTETHLNGYISTYYLYKNHGQKWIKACELLKCESGLIVKQKRIHGCCVYDHTGSKGDGETWWAYSAGIPGKNYCKVGKCNNGRIEIIQVKEGGAWRNGCFEHICKDSDFVMNKISVPGSCNVNHGGCITNGTVENIWSKCQGVFCMNKILYKGDLKYCTEEPLLIYRRYN